MEENLKEMMREDDAKKLYQKITEEYNLQVVNEMIKNNYIEFNFGDSEYRVHMLNSAEKELLDRFRKAKFGEMMQDKNILFRNQLIKLYKEKGIDIDDIETKIRRIEGLKKAIQNKIGENLSKDANDKFLNQHKKDYDTLSEEQGTLQIQIDELLIYSFETQLENFVAEVTTYLSLEKKVNEMWKKSHESFESFQNEINDELKRTAAFRSLLLQVKFTC